MQCPYHPPSLVSIKDLILQILTDKKAENIVTLDLYKKSDVADFFIIATATNRRHLQALAHYVQEESKLQKIHMYACDGMNGSDWIIIDFGMVMVHLFLEEARVLYNLDKLWSVAASDHPLNG